MVCTFNNLHKEPKTSFTFLESLNKLMLGAGLDVWFASLSILIQLSSPFYNMVSAQWNVIVNIMIKH